MEAPIGASMVNTMRERLFAPLILATLITLFFYDVIFLGKTLSASSLLPGATPSGPYGFSGRRPLSPFSFDPPGNAWVNEPGPYVERLLLDSGEWSLWNPYEGLGIPQVGNLNTEVLNPLKLCLNLWPGPLSEDVFLLLRLFVMGLFTYLFLRERRLSSASCLLGSSFFMLSGYSVWWINLHPLSTVTYLPAVFYFYERWSRKGEAKSAFLASLSLSFAVMAGKIPDVLLGLFLLFVYALWKGLLKNRLKGLFSEGGKVVAVSGSALLLASAALLPFLELYSLSSPLARAIRTGAASHTIPFITSISLLQPMFLGWGNYFYGSWMNWTPRVILPHAAVVIILLTSYAGLSRRTLAPTAPFFLFSILMISVVFGILPAHLISKLPVVGSIEFLKYNAMLYFSLAVISASAFDNLLGEEGDARKLNLSIAGVSFLIFSYFLLLRGKCPPEMSSYLTAVLLLSLLEVAILGLAFRLIRSKKVFGATVFALLFLELFLYMPKDHPDRSDPYAKPPYVDLVKEKVPYRILGDGGSVPPLVSNGLGLYDIRSISVLLPGAYYTFFENLISFSVPQTNNPLPLFSATSPVIDLAGVKYVLTREPLSLEGLAGEVRTHLRSLRWIRFFESMISHTIDGGATYGFHKASGEERFSFFFPGKFRFEARVRVTEPFLFSGIAIRDAPKNSSARVRIVVDKDVTEVDVRGEDGWKDLWIDISRYMGKVVEIRVESDSRLEGTTVLGDMGLTPGEKVEKALYETLLARHKAELPFLKDRGTHEGMHLYENSNVMDRAFIVHEAKAVNGLPEVVNQLQSGLDFRKAVIAVGNGSGLSAARSLTESYMTGNEGFQADKVAIKKYTPDEITIQAETKGGVLVLSDLYYPGWRVEVNGRDEEVVKAFGVLRGVVIGKGRSDVVFYYRPLSIYLGIITSLATFAAWILVINFGSLKKRFIGRKTSG